MKSILSLIFMVVAISSQCQINRNIIGLTLGETTEKQFTDYLIEKNIKVTKEYKSNGSQFYETEAITFANRDFKSVLFCFYKDKLLFVNFTSTDIVAFEILGQSLISKYEKYFKPSDSEYSIDFDDGNTMIWLVKFSTDVSIKYVDKKLSEQTQSDSISDL